MTLQQQKDVLDYTYNQLTEFCGKPPIGSVYIPVDQTANSARLTEPNPQMHGPVVGEFQGGH